MGMSSTIEAEIAFLEQIKGEDPGVGSRMDRLMDHEQIDKIESG
jgi:hypothetical protein